MKARILVVDDNIVNLKVLIGMVTKLGYEGIGVKNGEEAVNKLKTEKYSLVLMDCNMPVMDGYIATQTIREMEFFGEIKYEGGYKHIPVIALTADVLTGVREKCIDSGMDNYLSKPVDIKVLGKCILSYLENKVTTFEQSSSKQIQPIDIETLTEYKRLTGDKFYELATTFVNDKLQNFSELRDAVSSNDSDVIVTISHKLAGSYGFLGAHKASLLCKELEQAARSSKLDGCIELINNIEQEHQKFVLILKEQL